jgi:hypothetical protein
VAHHHPSLLPVGRFIVLSGPPRAHTPTHQRHVRAKSVPLDKGGKDNGRMGQSVVLGLGNGL